MEALVRAVFYEDQSLDEVTGADQMRFQTMSLRMIVHKSPEIYAQLDQYLEESKALALEWESEG